MIMRDFSIALMGLFRWLVKLRLRRPGGGGAAGDGEGGRFGGSEPAVALRLLPDGRHESRGRGGVASMGSGTLRHGEIAGHAWPAGADLS